MHMQLQYETLIHASHHHLSFQEPENQFLFFLQSETIFFPLKYIYFSNKIKSFKG